MNPIGGMLEGSWDMVTSWKLKDSESNEKSFAKSLSLNVLFGWLFLWSSWTQTHAQTLDLVVSPALMLYCIPLVSSNLLSRWELYLEKNQRLLNSLSASPTLEVHAFCNLLLFPFQCLVMCEANLSVKPGKRGQEMLLTWPQGCHQEPVQLSDWFKDLLAH